MMRRDSARYNLPNAWTGVGAVLALIVASAVSAEKDVGVSACDDTPGQRTLQLAQRVGAELAPIDGSSPFSFFKRMDPWLE